jgi:glycogen debranching enzyme
VRSFWLRDIAETRTWTVAPQGVADLSAALSGSTAIFGEKRTPLASVNFITAHDGFTLADLVSYNEKHNEANLEDNRDGTTNNLSFNFGIEGPTDDDAITLHRRRAMRSLLGTLFVSAGVPMLTAGDELGRTQVGNNNTYCHDNERNWVNWNLAEWQLSHLESTRRLIQIRRENPALRNVTAARPTIRRNLENIIEEAGIEHHVSQMDWFDARGLPLSLDDWESSLTRTLQYFVSTPEADGPRNRILVLVHGMEASHEVVLPRRPDVSSYTLLWDSSHAHLREQRVLGAGTTHVVGPTSISIYRID